MTDAHKGDCSHCGTEGIDVTTYDEWPGPTSHDLCVYCEQTGWSERQGDVGTVTAVTARFMHVLESRLADCPKRPAAAASDGERCGVVVGMDRNAVQSFKTCGNPLPCKDHPASDGERHDD